MYNEHIRGHDTVKELEVVAGIITFEDTILCMERGKAKYEYVSYKYEFPGGKIEPGETPTQALHRELTEELKLDVNVQDKDFYMTIYHTYPDFKITMHAFLCRVKSKEFVLTEHVDYKWLRKEELVELDWAAADKPIVEKLSRG